MAAPYVAGAAVLVREAMELAGYTDINSASIYRVLQDTSDSIWDSITKQSYDRLDLHSAIDSIIPDDTVGDSLNQSLLVDVRHGSETAGWLNQLGDRDMFRFTPSENARITIDADSSTIDSFQWSLFQSNTSLKSASGEQFTFDVVAGQTYSVSLTDSDSIGSYSLHWSVASNGGSSTGGNQANGGSGSGGSNPNHSFDAANATNLGTVDYLERSEATSGSYTMKATQNGVFSIQLESESISAGSIRARVGQSSWIVDSTWQDGQLRLDLQVTAGQSIDLQLIDTAAKDNQLDIANLLQSSGSTAKLSGTNNNEQFAISLEQGLRVSVGAIDYVLDPRVIQTVEIDGGMGNDDVRIVGSQQSEALEMRPGSISLESNLVKVTGQRVEQVFFDGRGGSDRAFMYDADTDDMLTANPHAAEMTGIGYRYQVQDVDRIFVHATAGGQDVAYLFDSRADDTLVIRPQFSSMRSEDYLNYVSGFERVNAYANAGGIDTAQLYDSLGDDRFNTSGEAASIVGSGFFSYTRSFENVEAYSTAGGRDTAALYAQNRSSITVGIDFSSFEENDQSRIARGFKDVLTYVDNQSVQIARGTIATALQSELTSDDRLDFRDSSTDETLMISNGESLASSDGAMHEGSPARSSPSDWLQWNDLKKDSGSELYGTAVRGEDSMDDQGPLQMLASLMELRRSLGADLDRAELGLIANPEIEKSLIEQVFARKG